MTFKTNSEEIKKKESEEVEKKESEETPEIKKDEVKNNKSLVLENIKTQIQLLEISLNALRQTVDCLFNEDND